MAAYVGRSLLVCVCCTVLQGGVTAPKHVGASLM